MILLFGQFHRTALGVAGGEIARSVIENLPREHVSERERLRASAYYFHLVTGEIEKANEMYERWAQAYPRDNVPRSNLGVTYGYLGQYEKAVAEIREALRLNPESGVGYTNLVSHYAALNRLADAKDIYRQALERKLENPYLHLNRYAVAFLEKDAAEMQRQIDWAAGKVQAEDLLLSAQSDTQAYWGKLQRAREFSKRASESAQSHEQNETAAEWEINAALREAEFGYAALARKQAVAVLARGIEPRSADSRCPGLGSRGGHQTSDSNGGRFERAFLAGHGVKPLLAAQHSRRAGNAEE
jgi:tetratricopeptide (TPR) repeat protein